MLPLGRAGLAERNVDARAAVARPPGTVWGADEFKRNLDALGVLGGRADLLDLPRGEFRRRRRVERERILAEVGVVPGELRPSGVPGQVGAVRAKLIKLKRGRQRLGQVDGDQRQDAARNAAGRNGGQPGGRLLVKLGREVGDDEHAVRLGDLFGDGVVLFDRGVLVPQVFLRHRLHVRRQVGQPLVDLARVGPDLLGDEGAVEVGQMHERAEIAADADGIDDGEPHLSRRQAGQQPEHRRLEHGQCRPAPVGRGLDQEVGARGKCPQGRERRTTPARPPSSEHRPAIPRGRAASSSGIVPKRTTGGTTRGNERSVQALRSRPGSSRQPRG